MTGRHRKSKPEKAPDRILCKWCRKVVPGWKVSFTTGGPLTDEHDCVEIPPASRIMDAASNALYDRRNRKKG